RRLHALSLPLRRREARRTNEPPGAKEAPVGSPTGAFLLLRNGTSTTRCVLRCDSSIGESTGLSIQEMPVRIRLAAPDSTRGRLAAAAQESFARTGPSTTTRRTGSAN